MARFSLGPPATYFQIVISELPMGSTFQKYDWFPCPIFFGLYNIPPFRPAVCSTLKTQCYLRVLTAKNSKKVVLIKFFEIQIDMFPESTFHGDFRAPHSLGLGSTVYA